MTQEPKRFANLFGNSTDISIEERDRVVKELQKIGSLTFKTEKHEYGWISKCIEVEGLIAGNTNPNPSQSEIESQVREAIFAAFNVKFQNLPSKVVFEYSLS